MKSEVSIANLGKACRGPGKIAEMVECGSKHTISFWSVFPMSGNGTIIKHVFRESLEQTAPFTNSKSRAIIRKRYERTINTDLPLDPGLGLAISGRGVKN